MAPLPAVAISLDSGGEMRLGVRAYTAARVGTEQTDVDIREDRRSLTFPKSAAGHLRQHRTFVEVELKHDLRRLVREGFGPFALLRDLPFDVSSLRYDLTYRGEWEGVYDYGPSEFRTSRQYFDDDLVPSLFSESARNANVRRARRRLRDIGVERQRLFQAFVDAEIGDLFLRFGRQILVWGETDAFRLLDNINPTDSSFGGFLTSLDERRVPLDMLRASYYLGNLGPITEAFLEGYVAIDDEVGFAPGIPQGSPWQLPNFGAPSTILETTRQKPDRTFEDARGGGQLKLNAPIPGLGTGTFGLVHYYTYLDIPGVELVVSENFPVALNSGPGAGFLALALQTAPRVQITGATSTFVIPSRFSRPLGLSGEPVIRMELAYFRDEPRFAQAQLDPFIFKAIDGRNRSGRRRGDSWNFVLGIDHNQYIRWLNRHSSFLISTQFFFKHLKGARRRQPFTVDASFRPGCAVGSPGCTEIATDGEVLPALVAFVENPFVLGLPVPVEPVFVRTPVNQYLQTLIITTNYLSGRVTPALSFFYDWSGAFVAIAGVTFSHDPFRFRVEYDYLEASRLKGSSGVSLLRDRDNVLFQVEYVL